METKTRAQMTRKNMGNPIVSHWAFPQHAHVLIVRSTVPFRSIRQAMLHVTCLPKIWIRHMGEMTVTYLFFGRFLGFFLRFLKPFSRVLFMVSALGQNGRYNRYISAFSERLLRVTAELIEMAQYFEAPSIMNQGAGRANSLSAALTLTTNNPGTAINQRSQMDSRTCQTYKRLFEK